MEGKEIDPREFPYERYLETKAAREAYLDEWAAGRRPRETPVIIIPDWDMWNDNTCRDRERFLRHNLWGMARSAEWPSDGFFPHLQPWYGVGLYASAFGCRYVWDGDSAPQTRPIYTQADEVARINPPRIGESAPMCEVLERIRWYRQVTGDRLPICLTDTQSPNDTGSLIMEVNEFFAVSSYQPERLERFMNAITDTIIAFSEMQMEAIGPNLSLPGHQMICHPAWKGISISDDNMAMLSPRAYEAAALPYNSRLARHFGGIAIHSCGAIGHNIAVQRRTPHLQQMETSASILVRDSDPSPNQPESLRDGYRGSGVIVKVRINKGEAELLERLLAPDFKCALHVTGVQSREEAEEVYGEFKARIAQISAGWPQAGMAEAGRR